VTLNGWIQILFFFGVILACTKPLGAFMHKVMEGEKHFLSGPLGWLERLVLRLSGADGHEQRWTTYTLALLAFSVFGMLVTYAIQRLQAVLPFNPQKLAEWKRPRPSTPPPASPRTRTGRATSAKRR
jgi:K+-transporting ATPase ATPase A chain